MHRLKYVKSAKAATDVPTTVSCRLMNMIFNPSN